MIVGTAGHIDHGKTTLIRALTGVDTDRLEEEKARGISIELGYAYVPLADGGALGFVDVPGHEKLIHTMAAGACGIGFALLVIAADDGVMPQTREHVAILELFGVARGAVALTKVDRVDSARLAAVEAEVRAFLQATLFREAPVFPVNATAGDDVGTRALKDYLEGAAVVSARAAAGRGLDANAGPGADADTSAGANASLGAGADTSAGARAGKVGRGVGLFRLAVDRVFTLAGHGTVAAGTIFSGSVAVGDTVTIFPSNIAARVRSIHAQNRPTELGRSGERCALVLSGVEKSSIKRGDWLADVRLFSPTTRVDVRLALLPGGSTVLKSWSAVHFHHGAAHVTARVVPLSGSTVEADQSCHAQLVFDAPICAVPGDRFVVRDAQALHTLGGGIILDPYAPSRKRRSPERIRYLRALERMNSGEGLAPLLRETPYGIRLADLIRLTGQPEPVLPEGALTIESQRAPTVLLLPAWQALRQRATEALHEFHTDLPDEPGPDVGRLRRIAAPQLADDIWRALIAELVVEHSILQAGPWLYLPGHAVTLSADEETLAQKLQPLVAAGRFNPPWVRDLALTLSEPEDTVRRVLRKQVTRGTVYQVVHDLFYDRQCIEELASLVTRIAREHGAVEAGQYRDAVSLGRKRAIQILEFFDRTGLTRRVHDSHILRSDSSWQMTQDRLRL